MANLFKLDFGKKNREKTNAQNESKPQFAAAVVNIPPACIIPNPNQPRSEFDERALFGLAQSIKTHGILQPLAVRRLSTVSENSPPVYELIAGERRLRAALLLGFAFVPCIISEINREESAELAIIENLQREDLNFFEQAKAIKRLIEIFSYTQETAAKRLAVSQSYIANKLRLLRLTDAEREEILENQLTERHARALLRIADPEKRRQMLETVVAKRLNVAETERSIELRFFSEEKKPPARAAKKSASAEKEQPGKLIVSDVRFLLNSIERAVSIGNLNGIGIKSEKFDKGDFIELNLLIPKRIH